MKMYDYDSFYQALLSDLKQTRLYQEAREEGRQEAQRQAKLALVHRLRQRGLSIEELAEVLELDVETIRQVAAEQIINQK